MRRSAVAFLPGVQKEGTLAAHLQTCVPNNTCLHTPDGAATSMTCNPGVCTPSPTAQQPAQASLMCSTAQHDAETSYYSVSPRNPPEETFGARARSLTFVSSRPQNSSDLAQKLSSTALPDTRPHPQTAQKNNPEHDRMRQHSTCFSAAASALERNWCYVCMCALQVLPRQMVIFSSARPKPHVSIPP